METLKSLLKEAVRTSNNLVLYMLDHPSLVGKSSVIALMEADYTFYTILATVETDGLSLAPPKPNTCVVWDVGHNVWYDAWDGVHYDLVSALNDGACGLKDDPEMNHIFDQPS